MVEKQRFIVYWRTPVDNRELQEKLKQLTDMIHALPMAHTVRYETQYVNLEADKWNEFLKQVALLGVDDAEPI